MKITLRLRLFPSAEQEAKLLDTMRKFNAACNAASKVAYEKQIANKHLLQKLIYQDLRREFGIPADMAIRVIARVCDAYKTNPEKQRRFRELGSVSYSYGKNYGYKGVDRVSLQVCPVGREVVPFVMGEYQSKRFGYAKGQAQLLLVRNKWYLYVSVEYPEPEAESVAAYLGIDMGIANLATDSTGERHSGADVERHRKRHLESRRTRQSRGTKSCRRRLRKMAGRQRRYQAHVNHEISKRIVSKAKALHLGIAIENLKGIREDTEEKIAKKKITVSLEDRRKWPNWSFGILQKFIIYKAAMAGVPVVKVPVKGTSSSCSVCGFDDKQNRQSQLRFKCRNIRCGHRANADVNAACNIAARGASRSPS